MCVCVCVYDDDSHQEVTQVTCPLGGHRTNTHIYLTIPRVTMQNHYARTVKMTPSPLHHPFGRLLVIRVWIRSLSYRRWKIS